MKYFVILFLITNTAPLLTAQSDQPLYDRHYAHHSWAYSGDYGPDHWAELDPSYRDCNGELQSPIDIISKSCKAQKAHVEFHYHPFFVDLINNGHTLIEKVAEPKALSLNGEVYTLLQFHFHTPSEHHVDHHAYPMEIHFVHQNQVGDYVVIAVLVQHGEQSNPFLKHFMKSLPAHVHEELHSSEKLDPLEAFPKEGHRFFQYTGSLTTPPCTEGVNWIVMADPVSATVEQVESIHQIIQDDNRPIQEAFQREVYLTEF